VCKQSSRFPFDKEVVTAELRSPDGRLQRKAVEIRTTPITDRQSRIALARPFWEQS